MVPVMLLLKECPCLGVLGMETGECSTNPMSKPAETQRVPRAVPYHTGEGKGGVGRRSPYTCTRQGAACRKLKEGSAVVGGGGRMFLFFFPCLSQVITAMHK